MMQPQDPSSPEFFEQKYVDNPDPWNFAIDPYESSRYDALLAALSGKRFSRAFEPGCSVGVLTERLAPICDELLAIDLSETAVRIARTRCAAYSNVSVASGSVTDVDPGPLDLLVLSEVGYYFHAASVRVWADRLLTCLKPGGTFLTCHWLGVSEDHILTGQAVQDILLDLATKRGFTMSSEKQTQNYKLACWDVA